MIWITAINLRLIGLLLTCCFILAPAMYFDLEEQEEKCIIEEIPGDTFVTGFFLLEYWDENKPKNHHLGLTVTVRDPQHEVMLLKRFGRYGKFAFTSHASGQHFLCVQSNSTRFSVFTGDRLKVHLDVRMGEQTLDPNGAKAQDTMKAMEVNLQHLIDQMHYISRQQDFQREREETFRQMSEETNGNVLWWAIIQTSILLSVGFWQMKNLKDFLIEKKIMSHWICCNTCFMPPGSERQLAVTNCGHIICNVCFQRGKQGVCLICKAKCQISPLSDKSSSEVQALFSDISTVAVKYFSEINKVLQFQARHQKRLLAHYQQKTERMKEAGLKMQQEMQQEMQKMSKKITEQNAYISKLEMTVQHQSSRLTSQSNRDLHSASHLSMRASSITKLPYSSPLSMSRTLSSTSLAEGIEINSRGLSHKPAASGKISLMSSPKDGCIGSVPHRASSQSIMGSHSVPFSATISREFSSGLRDPVMSPSHNVAYRRESPWETPVFKLPSAYKFPSVSSLGPPP